MAFKKLLGLGLRNLLRNFGVRVKRISKEARVDRANSDASWLQALTNAFKASVTHALGGKTVERVRPTAVVRARSNTVVATNATIWVVSYETVFVVIIRSKGTGVNARCIRTLLALNQDLNWTSAINLDLTDVGAKPAFTRDIGVDDFRVVGFKTRDDAGRAADATGGVKEVRQLYFFRFLHFS